MKKRLTLFAAALLLMASPAAAAPLSRIAKPAPEPAVYYPGAPMPPYAGVPNHAYHAPHFRWGWFGAERFPTAPTYHRGYYNGKMRWAVR